MVAEGYKETEIGVIPVEWEVNRLEDISELTSSKRVHLADYVEDGIPFYRGKEITLLKKNEAIDDLLYISEAQYNKIKNQFGIPKKNDILITAVGTLANTYRIPNDNPFYFKDGNLIWLKDITQNSIYIDYILGFHKKQVLDSAIGSSQKALTIKELKKIKIPLPPLKEQEKIADILSTADEKIDAIASEIEMCETLKKGLLQKLLSEGIGHSEFKDSELGKIPESWEVVNVENITDTHKQGYYTKDEYTGKGIYLIRITDLNNPKIDYSNMPMLPISDNDYKSFKVSKGDFLFARSGAIGRYGIVYEDYNAAFASYLIRFTFHQNKVINEYFGYFYETKKAINQLLSITQGSSNININANNIKSIKLALPPLEEQKQIANILSTADEKLEVLRAKKEKYETLKKGLLQKLLSGEVRV